MFPFTEKTKENFIVRTFSPSVDPEELVWHRDKENRTIQALNDSDWQFQLEDELPFTLEKNTFVTVPKGVYHRIIKGTGELKVGITKHI